MLSTACGVTRPTDQGVNRKTNPDRSILSDKIKRADATQTEYTARPEEDRDFSEGPSASAPSLAGRTAGNERDDSSQPASRVFL